MIARILMWLAVIAACAAVLYAIVWGYETWRDGKVAEGDRAGAARIQAKWDADRVTRAAEAVEAARQAAAETLRRLSKQQENQRAQDILIAQVRRDAAGATAAADGLRLRASTYLDAAGCGASAGDAALECIRKAAAKVGDILGQCAARHTELAAAADDARGRGLKCEADYDALTLKNSSGFPAEFRERSDR